ncbi:IclR family transcriptional regulator [Halostella sp. PRR32]|uniref:IclR family transcriptional regulator n=1 Tax=Halostella sp. PRR32 TaxID=3098147 RepID=UPI002B1D64D8|nr:IclR family transcriptional regulator [Halostella sp. PRR32]
MAQKGTQGGVKSDETLLDIIETVRERDGGRVTEIAEELDLAKSSVHSHLKTLEDHGFMCRDGDEYRIGYRFLDYGIWMRNQSDLFQVAKPRLKELSRETGHKVWCVIERDGKAVYLYGAEGKSPIQTYAREGGITELHFLAAGKAILAHLPEAQREQIVEGDGLPAKTNGTITDPETLYSELEEIRERKVAFNIGEALEGLNAVGAPIKRVDDGVYGAISLSGPANRLTRDRLEDEYAERLLGIANEIEINIRHI